MKTKLTKILLLSFVLVMIFGTVAPAAFESYDTYTYSIDGNPLPSPHAYTPDVETYDSVSMGLVAGYYWRYENGAVGIWTGNGMKPETFDAEFSSEHLTYEKTADGKAYIVTGLTEATAYLSIPATYEGLDVVAIAENAFSANANAITAVIIGENVATIGNGAFANAKSLKTVYTELDSEEWKSVVVGDNNASLTASTLYYYSEIIKFGNTPLSKGTNDIIADNEGNLYVADTGNNRIVILSKYDYKVIGVIKTYVDEYGNEQGFDGLNGLYVTNSDDMVDGSAQIFACDTNNKRVVVFDKETYEYVRTIDEPDNALLSETDFAPYAIAVDLYGRIYIVSRNCTNGIIVLSGEGEFTGFIGAQKITSSPFEQIWEKFQSAEDRKNAKRNLSIPFNNITVDKDGFVYVTINFTNASELSQQMTALRTKTATYSPVKKLNSRGVEIMKRNGFFDPGGEVISAAQGATAKDLSVITDISIGNHGTWTILDSSRSRMYTYDQNGNLLFAFGDKGAQVGNGVKYVAMTYQVVDGEYNLVLLDNAGTTGISLTIFHPTDYCDIIMEAIYNQNIHNYSETIENWEAILTQNTNFDLAYIGIGKALYNQGKYEEAMDMLASAYETEYYSKAFAEIRKDVIAKWMIPMLAVVIALIVLLVKFLGWAGKKNKATSLKVGRKTYGEEMLYVFHIIFHPFDGFWDLKHEKRGSVRAALTILGITILAFFYQGIGQGYMFNPRGTVSTIFDQLLAVAVPVLLWVVANWCLTTLFDGEGSMKDVFVATCYSLAPLPLFVIISTILTNILTVGEGSIVNLLVTIGYVWVGLLLFFGMVVTHDYSTGKNVITTLGTIAAMAVIMFIIILFSSLVMKMGTFVISLINEIGGRIS